MEERDVELVAYESAFLTMYGWRPVGNGKWVHPDVKVPHLREVAVGVQQVKNRGKSGQYEKVQDILDILKKP